MSNNSKCVGCKYAEWKRTAAGRLHPGGDGRCLWTIKLDYPIPASKYYMTDPRRISLHGGMISRKKYGFNSAVEDCPTFEPPEK